MSRGAVGAIILVAWVVAMGWNARRVVFRPEAELLALGAARLPPGAAYYTIDAGTSPAGMASVEIDTLPGGAGFRIAERRSFRLPGLGVAGRTEIRSETWLGPGVVLDSLRRTSVRGTDTVRVRVRVEADRLVWDGPDGARAHPLAAAPAVQTDLSWPLRFAAAGGAEVGDVRRVTLLDPATGGVREIQLRTTAVGRRVFADSADTDPQTGEWIVAGRDTVTAWRVEPLRVAPPGRDPVAAAGAAWVDEDGRFLEAVLAGGLTLRRTAFELAFFRDPVDR